MHVTLTQFLTGFGQLLFVMALTFFAVCGLISYLRYERLTKEADQSLAMGQGSPEAFELQIGKRLGGFAKNSSPFSLVLLRDVSDETEEKIQRIVRSSDRVLKYDDHAVGIILNAPWRSATAVIPRIKMIVNHDVRLGLVAFPEHGATAHDLHQRLKEAVETGKPAETVKEESLMSPDKRDLLDELTGVLKSEHIGREFQKYVAHLRKKAQEVVFLYIDVDFLKKYSSQYNEKTSNELLRALSLLLQANVREGDLLGRCGDDEFLMALACNGDQGVVASKRLVETVRKKDVNTSSGALRLTISVGVACAPMHGVTGRQLYEAAEAACRVAKAKGRNTSAVYDSSMRLVKSSDTAADVF